MENKTQPTEEMNRKEEPVSDNVNTDNQTVQEEKPAQEEKPEEKDEVARLQEELQNTKDKYIRLYSEFENFRKRTAKEKLEMIQTANERLITDLLPVADDFERAEKSLQERNDSNAEGFMLIHNKFKKVLEQYGLKAMNLEKGAEFSADFHEAITQVPAPEESLKGKIVDVVEKGYFLNDKVIRYAKVVVGN